MKKLILPFIALLLSGCLSPKTSSNPKYYQLQPEALEASSAKDLTLPMIIVGPVDLSPYLDPPQLAIRSGKNEIQYLDYHRWAEPISVNVGTVIAENLRGYFDSSDISADAPKLLISREVSRLLLLINRFETDEKGNAVLSVQWALTTKKNQESFKVREKTYEGKVKGDSIGARVEAMNDLVTELSLDIAKGIEAYL